MAAIHKFSIKGYYNGQFCRSLHEFHACLYIDKVLGCMFVTEPFSMKSLTSDKRKIPDIMYFDIKNMVAYILEVKPHAAASEQVLIEYAWNQYRIPERVIKLLPPGFEIRFQFMSNCSVKLKKAIINAIGETEYTRLLKEYRNQVQTYTGFPGQLNPMYGRKHSAESKKRMSDRIVAAGGHAGEKNGMYGKTHTPEAIVRCTAKWKDPVKKSAMMRKGMLTHVSKFASEQYNEFMLYAHSIASGTYSKKPSFVNNAYTVNEKNIVSWFGDFETFFTECKNVK